MYTTSDPAAPDHDQRLQNTPLFELLNSTVLPALECNVTTLIRNPSQRTGTYMTLAPLLDPDIPALSVRVSGGLRLEH